MNAEIQLLCNELIGALLLGGAQGLVIVAVVWAVLKAFRRSNAATRHAVWLAALLVVAVLPLANFLVPRLSSFTVNEIPSDASFEALPIVDQTDFVSEPVVIEAPVEVESTRPRWQFTAPRLLSVTLVAVLLALAFIRLISLAWQLIALRRIKKDAVAASENLYEPFARVRAEMPMARRPSLLASPKIAAPMVVGFIHPAVLLPSSLCGEADAGQLENIFRHELAHLSRRDDWANLFQQIISATLFFHPAVIFVSRRLSMEREIACDDHALAAGGARRDYALFLTEFAGRMRGRGFTAAPAAWSSNSQLKERIGMILDGKRNSSPRVSRAKVGAVATATLSLAFLAMTASPRLVLAADDPSPAIEKDVVAVEAVEAAEAVEAVEPQVDVRVVVSDLALPRPVITAPRVKFESNYAVPTAPGAPAITGQIPRAPSPVQLAVGHPDPMPMPPRAERGRSESLERRLERLERMVESLAGREKGEKGEKIEKDIKINKGNLDWSNKTNFEWKHEGPGPGPEFHAEWDRAKREIERAQRDVEHAQREAERAHRNINVDEIKRQAMASVKRVEVDGNRVQSQRESLKARRQALEAQRKSIEKQLQALEKEMEREDRAREERDSEKRAEKERAEKEKEETKAKKKSAEDTDIKKRDTGDEPERK